MDAPSTADRPRIRVDHPAVLPADARPLPGVALVTIDRPEVRNAIDLRTIGELADALAVLDADPGCRAIVITGAGERAFAAGADIAEMAPRTAEGIRRDRPFAAWDRIDAVETPLIAAVRGYALGGGCELVLACDLVVAGDDAVLGLPEIRLGIIPGIGGTQRLVRAVGKARAMEIVLTGRHVPVEEAARIGLVSRVVPAAETLADALGLAERIAAADLVVTGEGFVDAQSFDGKVVGGVAELAAEAGVGVLVVCGEAFDELPAGVEVVTLVAEVGTTRAFEDTTAAITEVVGRRIGRPGA